MSDAMRPFHHGHKLVGALVHSTSQFVDADRWNDVSLPGVTQGGIPMRLFMMVADEDLWVLMHIMRDIVEDGPQRHAEKFRMGRRIGRLFHCVKTAEQVIAPASDTLFGVTDDVAPGASAATRAAFKEVLDEFDAWGGHAKALEAVEWTCRRFVQHPKLDDILLRLPTCEPNTDEWDVEVCDSVLKVLRMPEIEGYDAFRSREADELKRSGKRFRGRHGVVQLKDHYVDHLEKTIDLRVEEAIASQLKFGETLDALAAEAEEVTDGA